MDVVNSAEAGKLFQQYWPELAAGELAVADATGALSGTPLFRIESPSGVYALRAWWPERAVQGERVAAVLQYIDREHPGWVPRPIFPRRHDLHPLALVEAGGWAWNLEPWLPGAADWVREPSAARLESAARKLAQFHLVAKEFPFPLTAPFSGWESETVSAEEQLDRLQQRIDARVYRHVDAPLAAWPGDARGVEDVLKQGVRVARSRLEACSKTAADRQICWGDAWHGNLLFEGTEVTGLVDFATMRIDTPLMDLARLLGSTCSAHPEWREIGLSAYGEVHPLSEADLLRVAALEAAGTVVSLGNWIRWLAVEQREFRHPAVAEGRLVHFQARMADLMGWKHPSRSGWEP